MRISPLLQVTKMGIQEPYAYGVRNKNRLRIRPRFPFFRSCFFRVGNVTIHIASGGFRELMCTMSLLQPLPQP